MLALLASMAVSAETAPGLSATQTQALAGHLAKQQDARALALLSANARGTRWCELDVTLKTISAKIRLFADLAHLGRKQGKIDEAWTCLNAFLTVDGPLYRGDPSIVPPALGLTLEAGLLYEASLVFPDYVSRGGGGPATALREYKQCVGESTAHTENYMRCVLAVAHRHKSEDRFDPSALEQVLLFRSAGLAPRASVVKKLTPERRRKVLQWWERSALPEVKRSTAHVSSAAFAGMVRKQMSVTEPRCASRAELESGDCAYFELKAAGKPQPADGATWQLHIGLARSDGGALDDSCFPRRLYLTHQRDGAKTVHAIDLGDLGENAVCGAGGWGDWGTEEMKEYDPDGDTIVVEVATGNVLKGGGSAIGTAGLHEFRALTRFVCGPVSGGEFACLTQGWSFHEGSTSDGNRKTSFLRSGFSPRIAFSKGKAVLTRWAFQFTYPEYDRLQGRTFSEVVEQLPAIGASIGKRLGATAK